MRVQFLGISLTKLRKVFVYYYWYYPNVSCCTHSNGFHLSIYVCFSWRIGLSSLPRWLPRNWSGRWTDGIWCCELWFVDDRQCSIASYYHYGEKFMLYVKIYKFSAKRSFRSRILKKNATLKRTKFDELRNKIPIFQWFSEFYMKVPILSKSSQNDLSFIYLNGLFYISDLHKYIKFLKKMVVLCSPQIFSKS